MPVRPVWRRGDPPPALPAGDPLAVVRNPGTRHRRIIGIWCEAERCVYPVWAVIDARARCSAIPETLALRLGLELLPTPPSVPEGLFASVPVVGAMESCGIPDMWFDVRVTSSLREEVIFLGWNALENAAWERAG